MGMICFKVVDNELEISNAPFVSYLKILRILSLNLRDKSCLLNLRLILKQILIIASYLQKKNSRP